MKDLQNGLNLKIPLRTLFAESGLIQLMGFEAQSVKNIMITTWTDLKKKLFEYDLKMSNC